MTFTEKTETTETTNGIVAAIARIAGALAKKGVAKKQRAQGYGAGFNFRGIDDVQAALAPLLAAEQVTITPTVNDVKLSSDRRTSKGMTVYHALADVTFTLRHADGSSYTGRTFGEAADNGDKAVGKALSYAFKAFALQAFCVPTESTALDDPDATVHEPTEVVDYDVVPFLGGVDEAQAAIRDEEDPERLKSLWKELKAASFADDEKKALHKAVNEQAKSIKANAAIDKARERETSK